MHIDRVVLLGTISACANPTAPEPRWPSTTSSDRAALPPSVPSKPFAGARQADPGGYDMASFINESGPLRRFPGSANFDTPSGNITCTWESTGDGPLRCEFSERISAPPPRPVDCDLSWATRYAELTSAGARDGLCTGGIATPYRANVLPYDTALIVGQYGCLSEFTGVTCRRLPTAEAFSPAARGSHRSDRQAAPSSLRGQEGDHFVRSWRPHTFSNEADGPILGLPLGNAVVELGHPVVGVVVVDVGGGHTGGRDARSGSHDLVAVLAEDVEALRAV